MVTLQIHERTRLSGGFCHVASTVTYRVNPHPLGKAQKGHSWTCIIRSYPLGLIEKTSAYDTGWIT